MKFAIITHVVHMNDKQQLVAYEPYVREMNLWIKHVDEVQVVAPFSNELPTSIDTEYIHGDIDLKEVPYFDITSIKNSLKTIFIIPVILFQIYKSMRWADHIHLRCPGNMGLLGCIVQLFFPSKPKTVKYAGNWDPKSKQPFTYRIQKWIISNTFLTKNLNVLVYGVWENQSKNITPFFTATYSKKDIVEIKKKDFSNKIRFIFVGGFTIGKQPLISVKVIEQLKLKGFNIQLDMYGDGVQRNKVQDYILNNSLEAIVNLHGNVDKQTVKNAFQESHFLVFISKSEGWPKVVAEAMFWSCLPITTKVSCVPFMLDYGNRGVIVNTSVTEIVNVVETYLRNEKKYLKQVKNARNWSQNYTLEKFESEIKKLLKK
ncbi:glycosyltransferase [Urechidicola croceus]|uniref:Glycosyl transferase n=1 Tax=Urechidicola croceus TaxID=1850246 RepID=A0A1D8P4N0_9FLAO|nr:glycosyltransferase [Urechidicola croceus]AOW19516.1 glycosyl transferase [Urechidicola croceus]